MSSPGTDSANRCTNSFSDVLASSDAVPLSLSLSPALSPEEFQRLWLQRQTEQGAEKTEEEEDYVCLEECVQCPAITHCSPQSLQAAMQLVNIQTLAYTPPHTLPWRVYLYTHTQRAHSGNTPHSTLILGELLYTGEANQKVVSKEAVEGGEEKQVKEGEEATVDGLSGRESVRINGEEEEVKVTLKQQPRDDKALKGFLSIITTVLHTLSSEQN